MPVFDRDQQRVVVRIVYDGPAQAGKTTNLEQLCHFFTTKRRSEMVATGDRAGRTLYFDWLLLDGGLVAGYPLRCQLVTVPGQGVLHHRRAFLLRHADSVVFICDSTPGGIDVGRRMAASLLGQPGPQQVPIVVQANKQDLPGSLESGQVVAHLGLASDVPHVPASAHAGIGVRETLVLAIRAAADRAQRELRERGTAGLTGTPDSSEALLAAMLAEESEDPGQLGSRASVVLAAFDAGEAPVADASASPEPAVAAGEAGPPLPSAGLATGSVWPAATGREVLQRLGGREVVRIDGEDDSGTHVFRAAEWCLRTSRRRRFASADEGRVALVELARRMLQLGDLLPVDVVLCIVEAPDRAGWLWTVSPWLTTIESWLQRADRADDEPFLEIALTAFAEAVVRALLLAARDRIRLEIAPAAFSVAQGRIVYVGDAIEVGARPPGLGGALLAPAEAYGHRPAAVAAYASDLAASVRTRLGADDLRQLGLEAALTATETGSAAATAARERLLAAVGEAA